MLVTCGCSFVWGDELKGCKESPPTHWSQTFTHHLADRLGLEYRNIARPGNGNMKIFRDVVEYLDNHDDVTHMVVLWSDWGREEFAEALTPEEEKNYRLSRQICMSQVSSVRTTGVKFPLRYAVEDMYRQPEVLYTHIVRGLTFMKALKVMCDARKIKLVQGVFHSMNWTTMMRFLREEDPNWKGLKNWMKRTIDDLPPWQKVGLQNFYSDMITYSNKNNYPRCIEGHPGPECNEGYAKLLHHIFKTTPWWE
jgi:hypothetical protein